MKDWIKPISISLAQGCPILLLESQYPTEFSSKLPQYACLEVSSHPENLD